MKYRHFLCICWSQLNSAWQFFSAIWLENITRHFSLLGFPLAKKNQNKQKPRVCPSNWLDELVIKTASEIWKPSISLLHQDSAPVVSMFPQYRGGWGAYTNQISCSFKIIPYSGSNSNSCMTFQLKSMLCYSKQQPPNITNFTLLCWEIRWCWFSLGFTGMGLIRLGLL